MDQPTPTILVVEDAPELAPLIVRELQAAGFATRHAADGLTALELHASTLPDAVILDWMLPKLDGLEVLRQLRRHAATPVLMLTARDDVADKVAGLEVGADDYLTKPFTMEELIARVRALLRRSELIRQTLSADRGGAAETLIRWPAASGPRSPSGDARRGDARSQPDGVRAALSVIEEPGTRLQPRLPARHTLAGGVHRRRPVGG